VVSISEKERITILIDSETREIWDDFKEKNSFPSISELIREKVNFCIEQAKLISVIKNFNKFSHDLKEPLTSIKGFSQIILKSYADKIESGILDKIKKIYNQTEFLEQKINFILEDAETVSPQLKYDVLVIEDDPDTVFLIDELFELREFKIKSVNSGAKGLEELKNIVPKVILLDILLPDIDGYEVCKKIRENKNFKTIPIFYITAVPASEVSKRIKDTKATGYILKPFDLDDFEKIFDLL